VEGGLPVHDLGSIDLFRQQKRFQADMRMSKQEIRDEGKESDGNPQVKARIRRLQKDALRRRMMSHVPTATAVIVNPTHFAVAFAITWNPCRRPWS